MTPALCTLFNNSISVAALRSQRMLPFAQVASRLERRQAERKGGFFS